MENKKSFLSFKQMTRRDWGQSAVTGLLSPVLALGSDLVWLETLVSILALLGLLCGIVWIRLTIKEKSGFNASDKKFQIKNLSNKNWFIIILVLILTFVFYWVSVRPVLARQGCYLESKEVLNDPKYQSGGSNYLSASERLTLKDYAYKECLKKKGL